MATSFSLDDLVQPVTRAEVQQSIYDVLAAVGVNTTSWKPGGVVRTMIYAASVVLASLSDLQAKIARSGFLELAEDDWLTLVAHHVYGVDRIEATFATGEVQLTNAGGGVYSFDPDDLIFANSVTGKTYRNTEAVSLGALSTATVAVQATEVGVSSTSGVGEIDTMVTIVLGVTVENPAGVIGADAETDPELRVRCSEKLGSLSPFGPWDAYAFAVRSATRADGSSIGVNRIRIVKDGYGTVTTYLAGESGAIPGDAEDPDTDLGAANDAIQRKAAPLAVNAVVLSAVNHTIAVTYEVWLYNTSALTDEQIEGTIEDTIDTFFRAQPIGGNVIGSDPGKIFVSALQAAIFDALPEIFRVAVTTPAADVAFAPEDVAITGVITVTAIHQEPPPEGFGGAL
jgi:phage-related baseplate assembly protein